MNIYLRISLKIRDKLLRLPRVYRLARALYRSSKLFNSIISEPIPRVVKNSIPKRVWIESKFLRLRLQPKISYVEKDSVIYESSLDIIIPVFNRGDLASQLLLEIHSQIAILKKKISVNLICADDCSEQETAFKLRQVCQNLGFTYVRRDKNLGFIGNVNAAWASSKSDFVLLLNSDVRITQGYLENLLEPLIRDPRVGLSTNPTFEMFANHLPTGTNLLSLNAFLSATSENYATFVDACTAVGYSLVIRRSAVKNDWLLDAEYGLGYGEDSDLHYRVIEDGYRSVWNLENCVSHKGGASFDLTESVLEHRSYGKMRFFARWGARYLAEIQEHDLILKDSLERRVKNYINSDETRTWIVVPTVRGNIGGIRVASELAIEYCQKDLETRVVTLDDSIGTVIDDFMKTDKISKLYEKKASGTVILVGAQSLDFFRSKSWFNSKLSFIYFAQGPDWLIDPSTLSLYQSVIPELDGLISVSPYMDSEMSHFSIGIESKRYEPKVQYALFAGLSQQLKTTDFILIYRMEHGKLGWLTVALANLLSENYSVTLLSDKHPYGLSEKVNLRLALDRTMVLKEFSYSKIYIDTSIYEGFGLTAREAAYQNTKVIFMDVNDGRSVLKRFVNHFSTLGFSPSIFGMVELVTKLLDEPICTGCEFCDTNTLGND